jgi:hypothetical protein
MEHGMRTVVAGVAAALAVGLGAGPAAASEPAAEPASAPAGWVVENPRADGTFDTNAGSATIVDTTSGVTLSCPAIGGWGRAPSGMLRPQDLFGESGVTTYSDEGGGCTGPADGVEIFSSPGILFAPGVYDAAADRVDGAAYPELWVLGIEAPGCSVDIYAQDPLAPAPLGYDNGTGTLDIGPVESVVTRADGTGCAGIAQVGDEVTFATTLEATPVFTVRPA